MLKFAYLFYMMGSVCFFVGTLILWIGEKDDGKTSQGQEATEEEPLRGEESSPLREKEGESLRQKEKEMTIRLRIYEFLALPAHAWLWLCARLVGGQFKCGPVSDPSDSLE